jgi:hypothetical protein
VEIIPGIRLTQNDIRQVSGRNCMASRGSIKLLHSRPTANKITAKVSGSMLVWARHNLLARRNLDEDLSDETLQ